MSIDAEVPVFLSSFKEFLSHIDAQFGDKGSNDKGDSFLEIAKAIIPLTDAGRGFDDIQTSNKKTHDGGIDILTSTNSAGEKIFAQSKYRIRSVDDFDTVISKFANFEQQLSSKNGAQPDLFRADAHTLIRPIFIIVTISGLLKIVKEYEASSRPSKTFYTALNSERRLHIIDGEEIYNTVVANYRKINYVPITFTVSSPREWVKCGQVWLGFVSAKQLHELYKSHGDGLFFENIREFIGTGRERIHQVNNDIVKTIKEEPEFFALRNNGITIRAQQVFPQDGTTLKLSHAAIVNGCQTTMCIATTDNLSDECVVVAKVVCTEEAWDVAKSANWQNNVEKIELELARYVRPQQIRKMANEMGYSLMSSERGTIASIVNIINQNRIHYEDVRMLFIGLFSRTPTNMRAGNYSEILPDLVKLMHSDEEAFKEVFATIAHVVVGTIRALNKVEAKVKNDDELYGQFKRIFSGKPQYKLYLALVALCAGLGFNIAEREKTPEAEKIRMISFIRKCRSILENTPDEYDAMFDASFEVFGIMSLDNDSDDEIQRHMHLQIGSRFSQTIRQVRLKLRMRS